MSKDKLYTREKYFLILFLPLFAIKLLDISAESRILTVTATICFVLYSAYAIQRIYNPKLMTVFIPVFLLSTILVITSGKIGIIFSIVILFAMNGIDMDRKLYPIILRAGIVFLFIALFVSGSAETGTRFINGEYVEISKRSNILYVSFAAVLTIYLLVKRSINIKGIVLLSAINYVMFLFVGSRTGMLSVSVLLILLFLFKLKLFRTSKTVRIICITSPLIGLSLSLLTAIYYGQYNLLDDVDRYMQGRLSQGHYFLMNYGISIWGQRIEEGVIRGWYHVLDSAYMDMVICEGLIFTVIWIYVTGHVINYMIKQNRFVETSILVMYSVYGVSETFLPNCFLNTSILLYGEWLYATKLKNIQYSKL